MKYRNYGVRKALLRSVTWTIVSLMGYYAVGQTPKLDSLKRLSDSYHEEDSFQVILLNQISWEYHTISLDTAAIYAHEAREMAKEVHYNIGFARACNLLGVVAALRGDRLSQEKWNNLALPIAEETKDSFVLSVIYNDLANIYASRNESAKALDFYQKSLRNQVAGDEVIEIFTVSNIAVLYSNLGDGEKAASYWEQSMRKIDEAKDPYVKTVALMTKAYYHSVRDEPDSSRMAVEAAYAIAEENENFLIQVDCLEWLADLARKEGKMELAKRHLVTAAALTNEKGFHSRDLSINYELVEWYMARKDYDNAAMKLQEIYHRAKPGVADYLNILINYHDLSADLSKSLGDFESAYEHQQLLLKFRDTLDQVTQLQRLGELEIQYDLERQQVEYELMMAEKQQGEAKVAYHKTLNWALFAILVLAVVVVALIWLSARQRQQYTEQLKDEVAKTTADLRLKNEELEGFAHIVSHDLKEPLRNIISFVNLIERRGANLESSERTTYFGFIKKGANQLYNLVEDVLQFSKLRKTDPKVSLVNTEKLVKEVEGALKLKIEEKNAQICVHDLPKIESSEAILFLIFKNLIENGITYNRQAEPLINICYQRHQEEHEFSLSDNGMGIPMEFQQKVFKMFFRLHNRNEFEGTGLGLAIVKKLTDQLKGSISFESDSSGTTFFLKFPTNYEATAI